MATISEALAIAIQHHQAGRLDSAEQVYRQILQAEPNQADVIHLLGVVAHQVGKHEVAVEYIGRAIALKENTAAFHNNLGGAYLALRRFSEAVASYRRALELKPGLAEAHSNLGVAFKEQGKLDEAVACCRRALELEPDDAKAHNNLGNAFTDQGKLDEAVACYRRALELKPDYAEAHNNLGLAFKEQGKLDEAVACCRRALELKPDLAGAHDNLGSAFKEQGKRDEAVACYRRALELKPDLAEAHYNLGIALEEIGDLQGAEDSFRAALRHNPRYALAHYKLAELLGDKLPHKDLAAQRRLLEEMELTDTQRLSLHFALAKVLDAQGEYAEAAEHLERGNALQLSERRRCGREYDPKKHELLTTRMIMACTPDFFERIGGFGLESELPIFVVGLPRSGTTLIEQNPGQPLPGFRRGGDQTGRRHHDCTRRTRRRLHRGLSPVGPADSPPAGFPALGEPSRTESHSASHCGQDAGQLQVSRSVGQPVSAGEVHSLPPRFARRGHLLLDDAFPGSSLGQRPTGHCLTISPVPTADGALAEGLAGAPVGSRLRGDCRRSGGRGPKARGLVRPRVGADLPGISTGESPGQNGQRRPGASAGLHDIGGAMEALRTGPGFAVRPVGKRIARHHAGR